MTQEFRDFFYDENEDFYISIRNSADINIIEKYKGVLPEALIDIWEQHGWSGYNDGIFWFVNPDEYNGILMDWIKGTELEKEKELYIIGKSALGALIVFDNLSGTTFNIETFYGFIAINLNRLNNKTNKIGVNKELESFIELIESSDYDIENDDGSSFFANVYNKLGPLAHDEIYGYDQILPLGGEEVLNNLIKVKDIPHMVLLLGFSHPKVRAF